MLRRPWFVVILALLHIFTPVINIIVQSLIFGMTPLEFVSGLRGVGILDIYRIFFLMPVAGLAIYAMKRWSYPVIFGSWIWCMAGNYENLKEAFSLPGGASPFPPVLEAFSLALNLALVGYFVLPRVREAYYRPNIRWWEPQPRYLLNEVSVVARADDQSYPGMIENISLTGMKIKLAPPSVRTLTPGECVQLAFEVFNDKYRVNGQITRIDPSGTSGVLGVRLLHTAKSRHELKHLIKLLRPSRFDRQSVKNKNRGGDVSSKNYLA